MEHPRMEHPRIYRWRSVVARVLAPTVLVMLAGAAAEAGAQSRPSEPDLSAVRDALKKYEDPYQAVHDGYFSTVACIVIDKPGGAGRVPYQPGGMGVHFINLGLLGPEPDPAKPQVLLYEPEGNKLRLIGAEWFVPLSTGVKARPKLWGYEFQGPMMGHPPLLPEALTHYDLHVWLYKPNPRGVFSPTHPGVTCAGHPYRLVEEAPMLSSEPKQ
jgi:hypothetical protein